MDRAAKADLIGRGMAIIGEELPAERLDLLLRYVAEIELFNAAYGLVNAAGEELIVRHILDSLAPLPLLRGLPPGPIADLGSGAGLPGIPLAIMMPGRKVSLVERSGRRARFLEGTLAALGLPNAELLAVDAALAPAAAYGLVVSRAFVELDRQSLKVMKRLLAPGGAVAAYKGRRAKIEEELATTAGEGAEILPYAAPFIDEERHLVVVRNPEGS